MTKFDSVIGAKYLRGMHLNDSKTDLGSKKDRHENLGLYYYLMSQRRNGLTIWRLRGEIGLSAFKHIVSDKRTQNIPLILETPSQDDGEIWRVEIATLHSLTGDWFTIARCPIARTN